MKEILFICTGNFYRSRFAEAVFNHLSTGSGMKWRAFSRGLDIASIESGDLSVHAEQALARLGIRRSMTGPARTALAREDLVRAARSIALKEPEHRPMLRRQFPEWVDRIEYWMVHDLDCAAPEEALPLLHEHVARLVNDLAAFESTAPS